MLYFVMPKVCQLNNDGNGRVTRLGADRVVIETDTSKSGSTKDEKFHIR